MAERITFKNLLELVQKETGLDNKQSDRFIRQWIDIINGGLEKDGRVRIFNFGTFKLQKVAERKGFNPATKEKITIPAHTKVVFKGAKNLRETVNRKYNLLEAKSIIMPENNSDKNKSQQNKNDSSKKESNNDINDIMSKLSESEKDEKKILSFIE